MSIDHPNAVGTDRSNPFASRRLPAWLMSAALHFSILVTLGLLVRVTPRGAEVEPTRQGGIVLAHDTSGKTEYFDEQTDPELVDSLSSATQSELAPLVDVPEANAASAPLVQGLPSLPGPDSGLDGAAQVGDVTGFTAARGARPRLGGEVSTSVFGVSGTGSRFIYVFDRSGSMLGFQGRPLAAAKRELIASLNSLTSVQQFQIVFYNERCDVFNPRHPEKPQLLFGDEPTRREAERFVQGIVANGGTRHMQALRMALGMTPDVVFFLTDAAEPQLSAAELAEIRRLNRGLAVINTIEFGVGSSPGGSNFLAHIAAQNRGQYLYVDVTRLPVPRSR